jgi:hypothetical protein
LSPQKCRAHALSYSHAHSAQQFIDNVSAALEHHIMPPVASASHPSLSPLSFTNQS